MSTLALLILFLLSGCDVSLEDELPRTMTVNLKIDIINMLKIIRFIPLFLLVTACTIPEIPEKESPYQERLRIRYEASINLGQKYLKSDPNRSIEYFNKAIEINPNSPEAYSGRGIARKELKQYTLAIRDYNKALECDWPYDLFRYQYIVYCARAQARIILLPSFDRNSDTYIQMFSDIFIDLQLAEDNAMIFEEPGAMEMVMEVRSLFDD